MAYVSFFFGVWIPSSHRTSSYRLDFFPSTFEKKLFLLKSFFLISVFLIVFFLLLLGLHHFFLFIVSCTFRESGLSLIVFFCLAHLLIVCVSASVCVCVFLFAVYSLRIAKCGFYNRFVPLYFISFSLSLASIVQRFNRLTEINTSFKWGFKFEAGGLAGEWTQSASSLWFFFAAAAGFFFHFSICKYANWIAIRAITYINFLHCRVHQIKTKGRSWKNQSKNTQNVRATKTKINIEIECEKCKALGSRQKENNRIAWDYVERNA